MIVVRPNWIGNKELIQEGFGVRKMTEWKNILVVIMKLLKQKQRFRTVRLAVLLQLIAVFKRNGYRKTSRWFQRFARGGELERVISGLFMTRFRLVMTPYSGVSLDVDTESDYEILRDNQDFFLKIQEETVAKTSGDDLQVFRD